MVRTLGTAVLACAGMVFTTVSAQAQRLDIGFGVGTMSAPSASSATDGHSQQSLNGGAYLGFSGNVLINKRFGVGGEIAWKGSEGLWGGYQPYRPILWDFNGVWIPKLASHVYADLEAGIGAQSTRFYTPFTTCGFNSCTNYQTSTHFLGHFGGGIRLYPVGNLFLRPEVHYYLVNNNWEFSSAHAVRYGVTLGYSFGGR
jgi:hypothetical protein